MDSPGEILRIDRITRFIVSMPVIGVALLFSFVATATEVSIKSIMDNPAQYHGRTVSMKGVAREVEEKISRKGNRYTTFRVSDASGGAMTVFSWRHLGIKIGEHVLVSGIFRQVKRVGDRTFYNQVDADSVSALDSAGADTRLDWGGGAVVGPGTGKVPLPYPRSDLGNSRGPITRPSPNPGGLW